MALSTKTLALDATHADFGQLRARWKVIRAFCDSEYAVKSLDKGKRPNAGGHVLVPFSPEMGSDDYKQYIQRAEVPNFSHKHLRTLISGLLRKEPDIDLSNTILTAAQQKEALTWLRADFGGKNRPLTAVLGEAFREDIQTGAAWVGLDYNSILDSPVASIIPAERVINWFVGEHPTRGDQELLQLKVLQVETDLDAGNGLSGGVAEHTISDGITQNRMRVLYIHFLDRLLQEDGSIKVQYTINRYLQTEAGGWELMRSIVPLKRGSRGNVGEPFDYILAFPMDGDIEDVVPPIECMVSREAAQYNRLAQRNHLLSNFSAFTPVIEGVDDKSQQDAVVGAGVGSAIFIPTGASITALATPTEALSDLSKAIEATTNDLRILGNTAISTEQRDSGTAIATRNSAATANLGALSRTYANTMKKVISVMLSWRYNVVVGVGTVKFALSADLARAPTGALAVQTSTETYIKGLISREAWLDVMKENQIVSGDYDGSVEASDPVLEAFLERQMAGAADGEVVTQEGRGRPARRISEEVDS